MDRRTTTDDSDEAAGERDPSIRVRAEEKVLIDALIHNVGNRRLLEEGTAARPTQAEAMEMIWDRMETLHRRIEELWEGIDRLEHGEDHGLVRGKVTRWPFPAREVVLSRTKGHQPGPTEEDDRVDGGQEQPGQRQLV